MPVEVGCQKQFCCFIYVIVGLTTVDELEVFLHKIFCCFSDKIFSFLAINDAMASSSQGGATIDS